MMVTTVAAHGLIGQEAALLLVLGINIGAGLPAVTATLGQTEAARRLPTANLICRTTFAMMLAPFADEVAARLAGTPLGVVSLAAPAAHIVFNLALVVLLVPFSGLLMRLMERAIPDKPAPFDGLLEPRYLDKALLERPRLAMATVAAEIARMTEIIDRMLAIAADALTAADLESLKQLAALDDRLGLYRIYIQNYLADITANEQLAPILRERALEAAMFVSNLEHAGDVIALALRERLRRRVKEAVRFRDEQSTLLDRLIGHVRTSLKQSASVIAADDPEGARLLIRRKASFGEIERQILSEALALPKTNAADQLFVEIVRELHKVNSQAASAAYPIADRAGLLLASRMKDRQPDDDTKEGMAVTRPSPDCYDATVRAGSVSWPAAWRAPPEPSSSIRSIPADVVWPVPAVPEVPVRSCRFRSSRPSWFRWSSPSNPSRGVGTCGAVPEVVVPGAVVPDEPVALLSLEPVVSELPVPLVRCIVPPNQPAAQPIAKITSSATTTATIALRPLSLSVRISRVSRVSMSFPSAKPMRRYSPAYGR